MKHHINAFAVLTLALGLLGLTAAQVEEQQVQQQDEKTQSDVFEILFDGSSLDAWRGYKSEKIGGGWKIDGDTLHFDGSGGGDIITKKEYASFELVFDWKVAERANSGVMYRVSLGDQAPYISGPEYQILDNGNHPDGRRQITAAASLYGMVAAENTETKPVGEWNEGRIVLDGKKIEHWLNGTRVLAIEIDSDEWKERKDASKFKTWEKFGANDSGHICLQDHGDKVWYRNIKIREIKHDE